MSICTIKVSMSARSKAKILSGKVRIVQCPAIYLKQWSVLVDGIVARP